jgi:hypothetical protein
MPQHDNRRNHSKDWSNDRQKHRHLLRHRHVMRTGVVGDDVNVGNI